MRLPYIRPTRRRSQQQVVAFGGVNYTQDCRDGELEESLNLSSEQAPCLSQRYSRKAVGKYTSPTAIYGRDGKMVVVDGTDLYYDGKIIGQVTAGPKQFATINTKIVIYPDKIYYDIEKGEIVPIGEEYKVHLEEGTFSNSTGKGKLKIIPKPYRGTVEEKTINLDTGEVLRRLTARPGVNIHTGEVDYKIKDSVQAEYAVRGDVILANEDPAAFSYYVILAVRLEGSGVTLDIGSVTFAWAENPPFTGKFFVGDAVTIKGRMTISSDGTFEVTKVKDYELEFKTEVKDTGAELNAFDLTCKAPDLVCICESNNRLWGASSDNKIHASALGNPRNWEDYRGISTDSWTVAVGTEGPFTACSPYGSTVLFFKENVIHKILGRTPAQYEMYDYHVPGVEEGSKESLVSINDNLYYKGRDGVYVYSGGQPELISANFGLRHYDNGVAGTDGRRYYISMQCEKDKTWGLWCYDTLTGIWLREDDTHALDFTNLDGSMHFLSGTEIIKSGRESGGDEELNWSATLCPITETVLNKKGYSRLALRAELGRDAWLKVEVSTDGGRWEQVYATHNERLRTVCIPVHPRRCDSFRVRLSGKGRCVVKSLVRDFVVGSEY